MTRDALSVPRRLCEVLLQTLYPPACVGCDAPLFARGSGFLCEVCNEKLEMIGEGGCDRCGAPAGEHADLGGGCAECRPHAHRFTRAVSVMRYNDVARPLVHALKFHGERRLAQPLGELMTARLREEEFASRLSRILPVPLHPRRLRERGYNQAALLAQELARPLGLPCDPGRLHRARHTPAQATLARAERLKNLAGAFCADGRLNGESVLLVDDVFTTGTTASECAGALREVGAARVYVLTLAR